MHIEEEIVGRQVTLICLLRITSTTTSSADSACEETNFSLSNLHSYSLDSSSDNLDPDSTSASDSDSTDTGHQELSNKNHFDPLCYNRAKYIDLTKMNYMDELCPYVRKYCIPWDI